ncbi:hypothetical protein CRE_22481 [Caenorhabditis remanei]|uniref:Uncharacterized protein n=1 Tax=Caenorhabditis remanei TaxID=31234 RepID=E3MDW5_CAERE|nr:hypothetical protein CRE_22481 [Caenorhabditis remanei]
MPTIHYNDEPFKHVRNMEFSLLFFVLVELISASVGFLLMEPKSEVDYNVIKVFYFVWTSNLVIASPLFVVMKSNIFAAYRAGFRIIHLTAVVYTFYSYDQRVVPTYVIGIFIVEFVCLIGGFSNDKMPYPGKWIAMIVVNDSQEDYDIEMADFKKPINDLIVTEDSELDTTSNYITTSNEDDSNSLCSSIRSLDIVIV